MSKVSIIGAGEVGASCAACLADRDFPACAYLYGEYGCRDIYLGVPVILGKNGIERVIELDSDDKKMFELSKEEVNKFLNILSNKKDC